MAVILSFVGKWNGNDLKKAEAELARMRREAGDTGGSLDKLGGKLKLLGAAAAGIGAAYAVQGIRASIDAASDLAESQSKVGVVFGDSAKQVEAWAQTSATSMLMSKQAAFEAAGTYGNLFQAFGIGQDKAQEMSTTLVQLSADLASFNNTSVQDAIEALRSGVSGETEPLKRYGVALNDVRLKAQAASMGLYDGKGMLDITSKTLAAYELILKDTALAQGDVARTADGYANTTRAVQAAVENAAATVGNEFMDSIQKASQELGGPEGMVAQVDTLADSFANFVAGVTSVGTALAGAKDLWGLLPENDRRWDALMRLNEITNPIHHIISAVTDLGETQRDEEAAQERMISTTSQRWAGLADAAKGTTKEWFHFTEQADDAEKQVYDLDAAFKTLNKTLTKEGTVAAMEAAIDAFAGLDTTKTVGKGKKAHDVPVAFMADLNKSGTNFNFKTKAGRDGFDVTERLIRATQEAAANAGSDAEARAIFRRGRNQLATQLDDIGFSTKNARAYAQQRLITPTEFRNASQPGSSPAAVEGQAGVTYISNFYGDMHVGSVQEAQRVARQAQRLGALAGSRYSGMAATGKGFRR